LNDRKAISKKPWNEGKLSSRGDRGRVITGCQPVDISKNDLHQGWRNFWEGKRRAYPFRVGIHNPIVRKERGNLFSLR